MPDPNYSFNIPSLHDNTLLDCRLYHPKHLSAVWDTAEQRPIRGAVIAHPYAPLGGCFDDPVVLSVAETLLDEGFAVGTFNFRGAGDSAGSTSLSGKGEQADYESFVAFFVHYLQDLVSIRSFQEETGASPWTKTDQKSADAASPWQIDVTLAGYSYGSLILARLPPLQRILQQYGQTSASHAIAETLSTASRLAAETRRKLDTTRDDSKRTRSSTAARDAGRSTAKFGGAEGSAPEIKHHHLARRSIGLARDSVGKLRIRRQDHPKETGREGEGSHTTSDDTTDTPSNVTVRYLLISPVVLPLTLSLCPPGAVASLSSVPFLGKATQPDTKSPPHQHQPTLTIFGNKDVFTSSQRLRAWAERQSQETHSTFDWTEIEGAGHFWREEGTMKALQQRVVDWMNATPQMKNMI